MSTSFWATPAGVVNVRELEPLALEDPTYEIEAGWTQLCETLRPLGALIVVDENVADVVVVDEKAAAAAPARDDAPSRANASTPRRRKRRRLTCCVPPS
jgi:hypothetical protein